MAVTSLFWRRLGQTGRSERGVVNVVVLVIVLAAVAVATVLLARTLGAARSINDKAARISDTGRGINVATDAVIQLNRTNRTADSILTTARPLEGQVGQIVRLGRSINGLARSILGTAGTINNTARTIGGTAGGIGATARGINAQAVAILDVGRRIERDVALINQRADTTIGIARAIKADTRSVVAVARAARREAAQIDANIPEILRAVP